MMSQEVVSGTPLSLKAKPETMSERPTKRPAPVIGAGFASFAGPRGRPVGSQRRPAAGRRAS